jgi:hypothetical protein
MKLREKRHDMVTNIYLSMFRAIHKEAPCNAYDVLQIGSTSTRKKPLVPWAWDG